MSYISQWRKCTVPELDFFLYIYTFTTLGSGTGFAYVARLVVTLFQ